jgi:hypothetical protein
MNIYLLWLGLNNLLVCEEKLIQVYIYFWNNEFGGGGEGGRVRHAVVIFWKKVS